MANLLSAELLSATPEVRSQHQLRKLRVTAIGPLAIGDTIQGYSLPVGAGVYKAEMTKYGGAPATASISVGQITSPPSVSPPVVNATFYCPATVVGPTDGLPISLAVPTLRELAVNYDPSGAGVTLSDRPTVLTLGVTALTLGQSIAVDIYFNAFA